MAEPSAIQKFCHASLQLDVINRSDGCKSRKQLSSDTREMKSLLKEEMVRSNQRCIQIPKAGGGCTYARLVDRKVFKKPTVEQIVAILSAITDRDLIQDNGEGATLPSTIERVVSRTLRDTAERASAVIITDKHERPRSTGEETRQPVEVSTQLPSAELVQMTKRLQESTAELSRISRVERDFRRPLQKAKAVSEESVADHLANETLRGSVQGVQHVRVEHNGTARDMYLRHKQVKVTKKPGIRTIMPILRESIAIVCERLHITSDVSPNGLHVFQRPATLREVSEEMLRRVDNATTTKMVNKVLLAKGMGHKH